MLRLQRGLFIAFEGIDRSGKSSQCTLLCNSFEQQFGLPVHRLNFPKRDTPIGHTINEYLKDGDKQIDLHALHLLFSANRWELKPFIEELLENGTTVIVDRYVYSGAVYSYANGLPLNWTKTADIGLPAPDLIIQIDLDPSKAASRSTYGQERFERVEFQKKVREGYVKLRESCKECEWVLIEGDAEMDVVKERVLFEVTSRIDRLLMTERKTIQWD